MIVIFAQLCARPGKAEAVKAILTGLFPEVRRESGVVDYVLNQHTTQPERFFFYERYVDEAVKDRHLATPYLQATLARLADLLAQPPVVELYKDTADIKTEAAPAEYVTQAGQWVRVDLQGRQKEFCMCWSCTAFQPEAADKGCPIIREVLALCARQKIVLPVWACPAFVKKTA